MSLFKRHATTRETLPVIAARYFADPAASDRLIITVLSDPAREPDRWSRALRRAASWQNTPLNELQKAHVCVRRDGDREAIWREERFGPYTANRSEFQPARAQRAGMATGARRYQVRTAAMA